MLTIFNIRPKGFNVGNDAIAIGLRRYLYQAFNSVVNIVTIPATSRYESSSYAGLTPKVIYDINQYGDGVIVGGGNLYENGELDISPDALESLAPPLMLFSLSRGRIYDKNRNMVRRTDTMPDQVLKALHKKACISLARDTTTTSYLKNIGCERVELGGCPTIFLNQIVNQLPALPDVDNGALISVRQPQLMSIPPVDQARVHGDIRRIIALLRDRGYSRVRILCHDHRDISFATSFPEVDFVYTEDVYDYLALLKSCRLNIAYRLHACLPCISFGVPTIKISYDERAVSLMNTIGCDDINVNMMLTPNIASEVEKLLDRLNPEALNAKVATSWNDLDIAMRDAFKYFSQEVTNYKETAF